MKRESVKPIRFDGLDNAYDNVALPPAFFLFFLLFLSLSFFLSRA